MRDFERVLHSLGLGLEMISAAAEGPIFGETIEAVEQNANGAFFIVQSNRRHGEAITRPESTLRIQPGDGLVIVGRGAKARALSSLVAARSFRLSVR